MRIQIVTVLALCAGAAPGVSLADRAVDLFPETTARPLFLADRRPVAVPVMAAPPPQTHEPVRVAVEPAKPAPPTIGAADYTLKGVIQAGTVTLAMVQHSQSGKVETLQLGAGALVNGSGQTVQIHVTAIQPETISFKAGDHALTLKLRSTAQGAAVERVQVADQAVAGRALVSQQVAQAESAPLFPKALRAKVLRQVGLPNQ